MSTRQYAIPKQIITQLDSDYFAPYQEIILETLGALQEGKALELQIDLAGKCLRLFWENYSRKHIANILESFPRVQRALFGLEEDRTTGMRYRDHYIHTFNVFITGSRILSQILSAVPDAEKEYFIKDIFKITREPDDIPFPRPYSAKQRLFFLWTLIATFHDVGIPVEHLDKIRVGLNRFLKYFGLSLMEFYLNHRTHVTTQLQYYFDLMARLYEGGIKPNNQYVYDRPDIGNQYMWHTLANAYGENNHGVVSGICLFNSFEETFLIGHHDEKEYDLTNTQYSDFVLRILEHDIARAALAISLHSLKPNIFPKLFPIDSHRFPLSFLLIFCDEIQESFRLEGLTLSGVSKLTHFPKIQTKIFKKPTNSTRVSIKIEINYLKLDSTNQKLIIDAATTWGLKRGIEIPKKYSEFLSFTWNRISGDLHEKLLLSTGPFSFHICVYLDQTSKKRMLIFDEDFSSK